MGQKTNANIFRLGIKNNDWKSKYFEKSYEESSLYSYQELEVRKYLKQFLKLNGLIFHSYKLQYSETTLHLFISYYVTFQSFFLINKINSNQNIISIKRDKRKTRNKKKFSISNKPKTPKKRLRLIKYYKSILNNNKFNNLKKYETNNFAEKLLESLTIFTKKKINIFITFQNLNKGLSMKLNRTQSNSLKRTLLKFRKNFKQNFYKETINILLICINKKNSARLLSEYISYRLGKLTKAKQHNFFLIFLKRTLIELSRTNFYKINGIKIVINGRFNGAPRARKKILSIGKIPLQSFDSKIDYFQSTSYTSNGTFGVNTWICENYKN
uniref:Ribosomal protein S3 n=1 Tax=Psammoneis japonica TaxID=517775 RepID=A0A2U9GJ14_9STRA|nr:ribosomal protein S3 [Psammoneis japonica]AWQ64252.1 ribosomal protein S3 [Psammoneis japonica]